MQIIAHSKSVKISPRKVRLVVDSVKELKIANALEALDMMANRASTPVSKTIKSALANAKNNNNIEESNLKFESITVTDGQAMKRFHPSTRGRIHPYKRRTSNIRVVLTQVIKTEIKEVKDEDKKPKKEVKK